MWFNVVRWVSIQCFVSVLAIDPEQNWVASACRISIRSCGAQWTSDSRLASIHTSAQRTIFCFMLLALMISFQHWHHWARQVGTRQVNYFRWIHVLRHTQSVTRYQIAFIARAAKTEPFRAVKGNIVRLRPKELFLFLFNWFSSWENPIEMNFHWIRHFHFYTMTTDPFRHQTHLVHETRRNEIEAIIFWKYFCDNLIIIYDRCCAFIFNLGWRSLILLIANDSVTCFFCDAKKVVISAICLHLSTRSNRKIKSNYGEFISPCHRHAGASHSNWMTATKHAIFAINYNHFDLLSLHFIFSRNEIRFVDESSFDQKIIGAQWVGARHTDRPWSSDDDSVEFMFDIKALSARCR